MLNRWHLCGLLFLLVAVALPRLCGQMTDEEKRRLFLQAREEIEPVAKPSPSATPRPKPKPAGTAKPKPTPAETPKKVQHPAKHKEDKDDEEDAPAPKHKEAPSEERAQPKSSPVLKPDIIDIPKPAEQPKPAPTEPPHAPAKPAAQAPILIEKSGLDDNQGYEPPPKPFGFSFFKRWRYLTPSVRREIDRAQVLRGRWKYIIVHNSGTRQGNARVFDLYHRRVRKMPNGLAYHFVIGNGNSSGDGEIEVGNRWVRQINGGHVASDYLNDIALGICLVGDFNRDLPTKNQMAALDELIAYLRDRVGKIKGRTSIVKGHKEINPKPTDCPGDRFPLGWLHRRFGD